MSKETEIYKHCCAILVTAWRLGKPETNELLHNLQVKSRSDYENTFSITSAHDQQSSIAFVFSGLHSAVAQLNSPSNPDIDTKRRGENHFNGLLLFFEPKPRFELGTPSLRVKCSTAELFRRCGLKINLLQSSYFVLFHYGNTNGNTLNLFSQVSS